MTLDEMVTRQSVSREGAELLRGIARGGHSYLVHALPRNAGKSTLTHAVLDEAPPSMPRQGFLGTAEELARLSAETRRGYLVVAEIGHRGPPGYLAGPEVVRTFQLVAQGWRLASSLHADSVQQVFDVLQDNGVDPAAAAAVRYLLKVRALGDPEAPGTRRVVEAIHEVTGVDGGVPVSVCRYQWAGVA